MPPGARGARAWVTEGKKNSVRQHRGRGTASPVIPIASSNLDDPSQEAVVETVPTKIVKGIRSLWATRLTEDINGDPIKYIKTTLRELVVYIFFLLILCIVTFGMAGPTMYYYTKVLNSLFMDSVFDTKGNTFHTLSSIEDYWNFAETRFLDGLYWESWYETKNVTDDQLGFVLHENKLLGVPRIRMLRVKKDSCTVAAEFVDVIKECYKDYSEDVEDRENFGPHESSNLTAWSYRTSSELDSTSHFGKLNYYGGGGFTQDMATNRRKSALMLEEMKMNLWLHRGTRAVFMDFTVYNANINLFCFIRLLVEYSPSGGAITSSDFRTVKLLRYVSPFDYFILFLECVFCLYIFYYMVEECLEIKKHKWKYFKSFWNLLDLTVIIIAVCCICFNIYRSLEVNRKLEALLQNPDQFLDFEFLSFWQVNFNIAVAVMTFFAWAKIFKYLNFNKTMTQLSTTLSSCAKDLAGFAVMFMIIFMAFAQLGHLIFGSLVGDFKNFGSSIFTLFRIILGDFNFAELEQANRILGPAYFLIYVFIVFFILFNMFLAIINDTYSEVKADLSTKKNEFELMDFFKERILRIILKMKARRQKIDMVKGALEQADGNSDKVIDFNEWRQDLKKRGYEDKEIEGVFKQYDKDGDRVLSQEEQDRMRKDLDSEVVKLDGKLMVAENKFKALHKKDSDEEEEEEVKPKKVYLQRCDFEVLTRRVDNMELSIGSIVDKIDTVLMKLETMEKSKAKRREAMAKVLELVAQGDGISSKERTKKMEAMMREEIQNWEKESATCKMAALQ